jgi:hypothetical protein
VLKTCFTKTSDDVVKELKEEISSNLKDKLKMFQGATKKTSISVSSDQSNKNIHASGINSAELVGEYLVTADFTGFLKYWQLK